MIVLDASAALLGLMNDGESRALLQSESIVSPHLVDSDVVHALRSQVLRGQLDPVMGERILRVWQQLGLERVGVTGLLGRVWELRANVSAYDGTYIALAEALECGLVTADARLAGAPGPRCSITVVRR